MSAKTDYTFEQFTAIRRYGYYLPLSFSPDGSELAYTVNTSGQFNLWRQPTDGGYPRQLTTYSDSTVRVPAWSPDGKSIAFNADQHGDECYQIFIMPADGGRAEQLTSAPKAWHDFTTHAWSRDGRLIAYNANDLNPAAFDVLVRDMKTREVKRLTNSAAYYEFGYWAPDSRQLIVREMKAPSDFDLYLIDIKSDRRQLLTAHSGEVKFVPGPWAVDGSGFYLLTDEDRKFTGLAFHHLRSGRRSWLETSDWDIKEMAYSPDGRYLAWIVNEDGYSRLHVRSLKSGKLLTLPELPRGVISSLTFSPNGSKLAFFQFKPTHCAEIIVLDLVRRSFTQLTHSMLGGIDERDMVVPKLIRYPTFDGRKIPAWLYKPKGISVSQKVSVILSIHGGPEAQELPLYMYTGLYQYWLSRGIGVVAPNIRGSTGYGKTYQKLIHHDWGGDELKDIEAAVKYLHTLAWVDPQRIGIFGASFGGFAVLSAISRLPHYWAAAADLEGPSNLTTLIKTGPPHWRQIDEMAIGNPDTEPDFLLSRSPITYLHHIETPLFIFQGTQDPRVPKAESDQVVEQLRARGADVRYVVHDDEGHGFTKRENELKIWRDTSEFLMSHLLKNIS